MGDIVCQGGYCNKCKGGMWLVAGILILVKYYWLAWMDWWVFVAALLILKGLMKMAMPMCSCCKEQMAKEKRRK